VRSCPRDRRCRETLLLAASQPASRTRLCSVECVTILRPLATCCRARVTICRASASSSRTETSRIRMSHCIHPHAWKVAVSFTPLRILQVEGQAGRSFHREHSEVVRVRLAGCRHGVDQATCGFVRACEVSICRCITSTFMVAAGHASDSTQPMARPRAELPRSGRRLPRICRRCRSRCGPTRLALR
jgi:hypothetical protein